MTIRLFSGRLIGPPTKKATMLIDTTRAWAVQLTHPQGSLNAKGDARKWPENASVTVVAPDIHRVIELVRKEWPAATLWSVNHVGGKQVLLADVPGA